ncbi:sulfotransferase 4A1-like [Eucyclogobius newberryi]|uniref:sulfotransferase 4A1-like n=1 Tax=Eucyclogobius newberryi TaxID=166745 RepID=UPI003B591A79
MNHGEGKVIYMARNPKDLVVSYYQFHRSLRTMSYRGTFQEFCRRFMDDKLGYGSWFDHVQEFWEHRLDSNVLFLKYEDMYKDLSTLVSDLARFLGVSCDKSQLETLVDSCSQLIDQCCSSEAMAVCRGRVGLWRDVLTVSMNERFDEVYREKMGKSDLEFDFGL